MKKLLLTAALLLSPAVLCAEEKTYGSVAAEVVRVHDGDTIVVQIKGWPPVIGEDLGVRVFGIDTRELSKGGEPAREFVEKRIAPGDTVWLSEIRRDKYFRIVAHVGYDCKDLESKNPKCSDLALVLLQNKYAIPYDGGTKASFPKEIK